MPFLLDFLQRFETRSLKKKLIIKTKIKLKLHPVREILIGRLELTILNSACMTINQVTADNKSLHKSDN